MSERERVQPSWVSPSPPAATRKEPERALRSLALGVAALAAFTPAALLADGAGGLVPLGAAVKNTLAVIFLTIVPVLSSARAERSPDAEDMPSARGARRFSPLAVGLLLALSLPMAWMRWSAVEVALVAQFPVALYLHVPRARACHAFVILWGALASATIDERAAIALGPVFALIVLGAVLDRSLDVRAALGSGAPPARLGPLVASAAVVAGAGAALYAGAFACVRTLETRLPSIDRVRAARPVGSTPTPTLDLLIALAAIVLLLGAYHLVFARSERTDEGRAEEESPPPPPVVETLAVEERTVTATWPAGPRRSLVERYLDHVASLASLGTRRTPGQAPLELADAVGRRAPSLLERAGRIARAFHLARYSPAVIPTELVEGVSDDAKEIEAELRKPHGP
jgi:hypothetical protein